MTTELLFREDAYLKTAKARVTRADERGIELDRTIFYPLGGGQPGDTGALIRSNGERVAIVDTRKGDAPDSIVHIVAPPVSLPTVGETLTLEVEWQRRYALRRLHTALHVWPLSSGARLRRQHRARQGAPRFDIDMSPFDAEKIEGDEH
jgi:misacylated tRNA(Ala) deacylase